MDNFDHATYVCMDAAGYNVHFEKEAIFNLLVEDWLSSRNKYFWRRIPARITGIRSKRCVCDGYQKDH